MPLYSNQIHNDEDYKPWKYWTFGLNLIDLNPSKVIRKLSLETSSYKISNVEESSK